MALMPSTLIAEARERLNHASATVLTAAKLTNAFNAAQERWAMDTECLQRQLTFNLVAGQQEYPRELNFPTLYRLDRVTIRSTTGGRERPIGFVPYDEMPLHFQDDGASSPRVYSFRGEEALVLWPKPPLDVAQGIILYARVLPDVVGPDATIAAVALPFPRTHREGLVRAVCLLMCEENAEDETLAARYETALSSYTAELNRINRVAGHPGRGPIVIGRRAGEPRLLGITPYDPSTGERYDARSV